MVKNWKQVSIKNIAKVAGVGIASVDRVLHNRQGVSKKTKTKILKAYDEILSNKHNNPLRKIVVCCESGSSFNNTLKKNIEKYLNIFKDYPYIFNLGHGVLPEIKPETIEYIIQLVRNKK